jgi:pyridoxine kinase
MLACTSLTGDTGPLSPGNRSATFPLQLLGWEVDVVNTTQLSNHTGYMRFGGMRLDAEHLRSVFEGMEKNGLLRYSRMLSGYIPSPSALEEVTKFVVKMKEINPNLLYLLDPVMGEAERGFYVDKDCLPLYKHLVGLASIICPNQFEAEQLADRRIDSLPSLFSALDVLHSRGSPHVIITSLNLPESDLRTIGATEEGAMVLVGSTINSKPWFIAFPEFKGYYVGVGDLFSALLLGRYKAAGAATEARSEHGTAVDTPLSIAAEKAIAGVQGVLRNTAAAIESTLPMPEHFTDASQQRVEQMRRRELRLIQSRREIEIPEIDYRAQWFPA